MGKKKVKHMRCDWDDTCVYGEDGIQCESCTRSWDYEEPYDFYTEKDEDE